MHLVILLLSRIMITETCQEGRFYDLVFSYDSENEQAEGLVNVLKSWTDHSSRSSCRLPFPLKEDLDKEEENLQFNYWMCIVTSSLLDKWACLMSAYKTFALIRRLGRTADYRVLPLVLGNDQVANRLRAVLPALYDRRPVIVTTSSLSSQDTVDNIIQLIAKVLDRGLAYQPCMAVCIEIMLGFISVRTINL